MYTKDHSARLRAILILHLRLGSQYSVLLATPHSDSPIQLKKTTVPNMLIAVLFDLSNQRPICRMVMGPWFEWFCIRMRSSLDAQACRHEKVLE